MKNVHSIESIEYRLKQQEEKINYIYKLYHQLANKIERNINKKKSRSLEDELNLTAKQILSIMNL